MKSKIFICLFLIGITILTYVLSVNLKLPYRVYNSDIFHQMSVLKEFNPVRLLDNKDPYFTSGPTDLHAGPYYLMIYLLIILLNSNIYNVLLITIVINIFVFICALYYFGASFNLNSKQTVLFIVLNILTWGSFSFFFAGLFEYSNLLITGSFPSTIGLIYILIILGSVKRFLESHSKPYLILSVLLNTLLLLSHLLSGVILDSFLIIIAFAYFLENRTLNKKVLFVLSIIPLSIILSLFIWPLFNFLTLLSSSKTVESGGSNSAVDNLFALKYWTLILGSQLIGIVFLAKSLRMKKDLFIPIMLIFSVIMTLSYLLPVRVTLYWRYFPFIVICLSALIAKHLFVLNKKHAFVFLAVLITFGVLNVTNRINRLLALDYFSDRAYSDVMRYIPPGEVVLSDPNTSYHLTSIYNIRVVSVSYNHANPAYIPESKIRYTEVMDFLTSDKTEEEQALFFKKYNVSYVLINKNYVPDHIKLTDNLDFLDSFKLKVPTIELLNNNDFDLFKLKEIDL
jgi:hypothetical protein